MIAAIVQARMTSTRLPGKVLLPLAGAPMIGWVVDRVRQAKSLDAVIIATTTDASDNAIANLSKKKGWLCFRGAMEDVLSRYHEAAEAFKVDTIVRVTSDCPLIHPDIIDECVEELKSGKYDFVSNCVGDESEFPRGLDVRVCTREALERLHLEAQQPYEREHVFPYLWEHPALFSIGPVVRPQDESLRRDYRLVVDYEEDYALFRLLYEKFFKKGEIIDIKNVIKFLDNNPEIRSINGTCVQKPYK